MSPDTELPTDGSLVHNWLYSFLPVGDSNIPALVGFCKQCRRQFIQYMPLNIPFLSSIAEPYQEYATNVPRYGCIPIKDA